MQISVTARQDIRKSLIMKCKWTQNVRNKKFKISTHQHKSNLIPKCVYAVIFLFVGAIITVSAVDISQSHIRTNICTGYVDQIFEQNVICTCPPEDIPGEPMFFRDPNDCSRWVLSRWTDIWFVLHLRLRTSQRSNTKLAKVRRILQIL